MDCSDLQHRSRCRRLRSADDDDDDERRSVNVVTLDSKVTPYSVESPPTQAERSFAMVE